jgi:AraC-like DNA-binding protein
VTLDDTLREMIRQEVRDAVADALEDVDLDAPEPDAETWQSKLWRVDAETRLSLEQTAEALDCSTRTVRRHIAGETSGSALPAADGPTGKAVKAGDLRRWIEDTEEENRWRAAS